MWRRSVFGLTILCGLRQMRLAHSGIFRAHAVERLGSAVSGKVGCGGHNFLPSGIIESLKSLAVYVLTTNLEYHACRESRLPPEQIGTRGDSACHIVPLTR